MNLSRRCLPALLPALLAAVLVTPAWCQPDGAHFEIWPTAGYTFFPDGVVAKPLQDNLYLGGRVSYFLNNYFALEANGGFTSADFDPSGEGSVDFMHYGGGLLIFPFGKPKVGPYLALGGGALRFSDNGLTPSKDENRPQATVGAGVRFFLDDQVGIFAEGRDIVTAKQGVSELKDFSKDLAHIAVAAGGVAFAFGGKPKDTDGDGVPDRKDRCPGTPAGAQVDANGCPTDADGDGVFDGLDQCANTPKGCTVDAKGCPTDADGDGVCDGLDKCPNTPKGATVNATGCPSDADDDGVLDGLDQCPNTPKGAVVDEKGCPIDSDGDGVYDGLDKCPGTPAGAKVDKDGCPVEVIERETELLDTGMLRLQNINFDTGKADLMPDSYPVLDIVGQVLSKWPELRIEIGGHTDSRGSAPYNQKLSEARAQSVMRYLLDKFTALKADQFSAKGYGESKPLVPNTSVLNMAKNRRVEFVVLNKDVLKREVEKRRTLQKNE